MNIAELNKVKSQVLSRVAPAWPLKSFVAVNPYMGFSNEEFLTASKHFAKRDQLQLAQPLAFYLEQFNQGFITKNELSKALESEINNFSTVDDLIVYAKKTNEDQIFQSQLGMTLMEISERIENKNWKAFEQERITSWAGNYFNEFGAPIRSKEGIYSSWLFEAGIDKSTEVAGLSGFRNYIKSLPKEHNEFIHDFITQLKLNEEELEEYLHAALLKIIGWSSYIAGLDFTNSVNSEKSAYLEEFLAVLLTWEGYFFNAYKHSNVVRANWFEQVHTNIHGNVEFDELITAKVLFQNAFDFASQNELKAKFENKKVVETPEALQAQMVFCIDVRSEVYRRHVENVNPGIQTKGFAGFFGFPIDYFPIGHETGKAHCPVLLPAKYKATEISSIDPLAGKKRKIKHQFDKIRNRLKSGAVTSFGYVSPLGLFYLPKLFLSSFNKIRPVSNPKVDGLKSAIQRGKELDLSAISFDAQVEMAAGALTGMGFNNEFAPLVLITGHGSTSTNNPHASGLECGACGGHSGENNALAAQQILNDSAVRSALRKKGFDIPKNTLFIACLHDTTSDEISFVNENLLPEPSTNSIIALKKDLAKASENARKERITRLGGTLGSQVEIDRFIKTRANDWSQIRPEWGLAGCNSFIIAPRSKTRGIDLESKAFLHDYEWKKDGGFKVLEAIMTAPMVVTSWINLQYYASATDNKHFGAGNKTLHNVVGGLGVLEGASGDLRIGLPLQSVHNGERLEHLPQRLNVVIQAPVEAINQILEKHRNLKELFDHSWIFLHQLDETGQINATYTKDLNWEIASRKIKQEINIK